MSKGIIFKNRNNEKIYPCPFYPVGSIFISVTNTNPSTWFGGTWQSFGNGRCLVGVDTSQTEFNTVMKTGGNKNMQKHNHSMSTAGGHVHKTDYGETIAVGRWQWQANISSYAANDNQNGYLIRAMGSAGDHTHTINNSGSGDSQNLQPYITVYMWRRTA